MDRILPLDLRRFVRSEHTQHHNEGTEGYIDIARSLLKLADIAKFKSGGELATFRIAESDLYSPLREHLEAVLPLRGLIDDQAVLHKTGTTRRTDLSIRQLRDVGKERNAKDIGYTHLIEIKSLFYGDDDLRTAVLEYDLRKLADCKVAYDATCFFALVGLNARLARCKAVAPLLKRSDGAPWLYDLTDGTRIAIRHAGEFCGEALSVFVFEVFPHAAKASSSRRSGASYAIFQRRVDMPAYDQ